MDPVLEGSPQDRHLVAILMLLRLAGVQTSEAVLSEDEEGQLHGHTVGLVSEGENLELVLVRHGDMRRWSLLYSYQEELQRRLTTWVGSIRRAQQGRPLSGPSLLPPSTALDQLREQCRAWKAQDQQRAWQIAAHENPTLVPWTETDRPTTFTCHYSGCRQVRPVPRRGPVPDYCGKTCRAAAFRERTQVRTHPCARPGCLELARANHDYCSRRCVALVFAARPAAEVAHG